MNGHGRFNPSIMLLTIVMIVIPLNDKAGAQDPGREHVLRLADETPAVATPIPPGPVNPEPMDGPFPIIRFGAEFQVQPQKELGKKLKIHTINYTIGKIKQNESVERTLKFVNVGDADLHIFKLKAG